MSSRALRKAQKEREAAQLAAQAEEEDDNDEMEVPTMAKPSAFAMLEEAEDDEYEESATHADSTRDYPSTEEDEEPEIKPAKGVASKAGGKKKKKKKKAKKSETATGTPTRDDPSMDEIDLALKSLSTAKEDRTTTQTTGPVDPAITELCKLLSIDMANLRVENEMRRLFGKVAFEPDHDPEARAQGHRQRLQQGEGVSLAEAVSGRQANGGAGLSAVLRRRNIFVPGKEDWPKATGGGLTMEIVGQRPGGIVEYTYVHNRAYQASQREFEECVQMMDPSLMINLLRFNPYHVSTLLQVSEISKHDRDPATSGELLERALFSFGRAVHSSFAQNLAAGKARLDFRRIENREFWLAAWRYIGNIGQRATWRTSYEWAKLLLSLDPDNDPYCVRLVIDQLALRARQAQSFVDLSLSGFFKDRWSSLPNIRYSQGLAMNMLNAGGQEGQQALTEATQRFPWVAARLFQELSVDKIPSGIWGSSASSPLDILYTELYLSQGIDLWKLPESLKLLTDTVNEVKPDMIHAEVNTGEIGLNEARFVILTDKPTLIGLIPREMTSLMTSASDPLPPQDSVHSYEIGSVMNARQNFTETMASGASPEQLIENNPQQFIEEVNALQRFFELLIPGFTNPAEGSTEDVGALLSEEAVDQAIARSGLSISELRACLTRFVAMREALIEQPESRVRSQNGDEVVMLPSGMTRATIRSHARDAYSQELLDDQEMARRLIEEGEDEGAGEGEGELEEMW